METLQSVPWWVRDKAPWYGEFIENLILKPGDRYEQRIQRLRDSFLVKPAPGIQGEVSIDRAILVTESYKETEGQPAVLRRARATEKILKNIPIRINPDELIVGMTSTEMRNVNICPEFHTHYLERELVLDGKHMTELEGIPLREECAYILREENKKRLREEIFPYWRGKNTYTYCMDELKRNYPDVYEAELLSQVWDYIYRCENPANVILDHRSALEHGLLGLKVEIDDHIRDLNPSNPTDLERRNMYEAMKIVADAIIAYAERYAKEAERLASTEKDQRRKKELLKIAEVCRNVPAMPASSWWEAVQSFWFLVSTPKLVEHGSSYSAGRLDQYLYPFLEMDLRSRKTTEEEAQEILECLWIKFNQVRFLYDYIDSRINADFYDDNLVTIGGVDGSGNDATNKLTYMMLEAEAHVHLPEPNFEVRVHKNSPDKLLQRALEVLRLGSGKPQMANDNVIIPSLMSRGLTLQEARNYASLGCQENTSDPNMTPEGDSWIKTNGGWYNLPKIIEYTLHNGVNPRNQRQLGPRTGDPSNFKSISEFIEAVRKQQDHFAELLAILNNVYDHTLSIQYPSPIVDLLLPGPRKRGIDRAAGGCKHNWTGFIGVGLASAGDSLSAIQSIVFDKKIATMSTLLDALDKDWRGYETLREYCKNAPKYGNDDDYVDNLTRVIADTFMDAVEKTHCSRSDTPNACGFFSVGAVIPLGWNVGATPDGRGAGLPLSDTIAASNGMDRKGPVATHKSAAKLDTLRTTDGIIFNSRLSLGTVASERDLHKWASLLRGYFELGGMEVSYLIVGREVLLDAQQHPERYLGLVVRVAGYSAFFVELSKELQDNIIARTEHSW